MNVFLFSGSLLFASLSVGVVCLLWIVGSVDVDVWHRAAEGGLLGGHSPVVVQVLFGAERALWMNSTLVARVNYILPFDSLQLSFVSVCN